MRECYTQIQGRHARCKSVSMNQQTCSAVGFALKWCKHKSLLYVNGWTAVSCHAEGGTIEPDGKSRQCNCWADLCSCCGPILPLSLGTVSAGSYICKHSCQHSTDSHSFGGHLEIWAQQPSCALELFDTWYIARRSFFALCRLVSLGKLP